ncbi:MAG TPA: UDP-N-acetylmuramoyl-L-alanyl-D-glutamate--2,6-diaminopimelate ligase [Patescibacteria group bacterium]
MHKLKALIPQSLKNIYHLVQAILANVWFGFPSKKLKVIGVTGTDGKTTTVQMITKILEEAGKKTAMASTINFRINGQEEKNLSHFTTLSAFAVQKFLKRAAKEGCEYAVLETSSHSLDQYRVWGIDYRTAVVTNVTREHLDYHKTMENYRRTKARLFAKTKITIVNADMEDPDEFLSFPNEKKMTYGIKNNADVKAENIKQSITGSKYEIRNMEFELQLPALFNIENALAATCVALGEGIELETIKDALSKIKGVPGRLEAVVNTRGVDIIVDFALTPESLEKLYGFLQGAKRKPDSKIIAVFGSCGDRDKGKRPIMGEVVSKYADVIVLTNDEPYHEDPEKIIAEIAVGIENKTEGENFWKIPDRREAIRKALQIAGEGDIIAVTGMGAEESMVVKGKKVPWNDRQVIEEELKKL